MATSFWGRDRQHAFFDVRVFNPFAQSYRDTSLPQCYRRNEMEKRRAYDERIREIEHGSFSPLVFSTSGGMAPTANVVYKRIASMISSKHDKPYSRTMHWIRCRLSFSLLCNHVPPWITICRTSASWSPHHHRHHGPCLLRWPGPMSELSKVAIIFVVIILFYSFFLYFEEKKKESTILYCVLYIAYVWYLAAQG